MGSRTCFMGLTQLARTIVTRPVKCNEDMINCCLLRDNFTISKFHKIHDGFSFIPASIHSLLFMNMSPILDNLLL